MAEKSIKKNFILNITYQLLLLIAPLIVTPHISRVLGVDNIGLYSYASSIISYFLLVAVLGTTTYAQRAIGYAQHDKEERSRKFWEVFIFRLLTSFVTLGGYMLYVCLLVSKNQFLICTILALNIINVAFDISWFLQGMEEFGKTTFVSIIFRILSIVSIFVFVKSSNDLWLYILFSIIYTVVGNLALWLFLPKYICKVKSIHPFKDTKTILQMFLPTVAIQIYTVLDKSMIGWFTEGYTENGYYEQSEKVVKMALTAVTALGIVMIPRISRKFKEGDIEQVHSYLYRSYRFVWMMAIPIMFGLVVVSSVFVPVFFGEGYEKCSLLIPLFSPLVIFIGLSNVTGMQYFVPIGKQNILTLTVVVGSIINLILNLIFIPILYSIGAAIASIVAELCVTITGFIYCFKTKRFSLNPIFTCSLRYWVAGIVMAGILCVVKYFIPVAIWSLIVLVAIGALVYFLTLLALRDSMLLEFINKGIATIKEIYFRKRRRCKEPLCEVDSNKQCGEAEDGLEAIETPECEFDETNKK